MQNIHIVVLKNNHLIFLDKKPTRRGNYTKEVKLFKTSENTDSKMILKWKSNDFIDENFIEITNWE
jgi:hypothetical protein